MTSVKAVAYYRTSSATNVGDEKDSKVRQRDAVMDYASKSGLEVVNEFYDAVIKGSDSISDRPAFSEMMQYILGNGARIILIETVNRFSRDLIVQMTGHEFLKKNGITLIPVDTPDFFINETASAVLIRQVLGAVAEFEKTALVDKLRKARERKRRLNGRCEGRKPPVPGAIDLAIKLRSEGKTLREIGVELNKAGYRVRKKNKDGTLVTTDVIYKPQSIKAMLTQINKSPIINEGVKYEGRA